MTCVHTFPVIINNYPGKSCLPIDNTLINNFHCTCFEKRKSQCMIDKYCVSRDTVNIHKASSQQNCYAKIVMLMQVLFASIHNQHKSCLHLYRDSLWVERVCLTIVSWSVLLIQQPTELSTQVRHFANVRKLRQHKLFIAQVWLYIKPTLTCIISEFNKRLYSIVNY